MDNEDRSKNNPDAARGLIPTSNVPNQQSKKPNKPRRSPKQTQDNKKKSYRRSWRSASPLRKLEIIGIGVGAIVGIAYVLVTAWGNLQTKWNFEAERRPSITAGSYTIFDTVTEKATPPVVGHPFGVTITLKNVGKSTALHMYIHRHVLFGKQYALIKAEPPDTARPNQSLDANSDPVYTTALSVVDTYAAESTYFPPSSILPWDGTLPIVVFGRVTYEDASGKTLYCTPFGGAWLNNETWSNLSDFPPTKLSLDDLCPPGSIR